MGEIFGQPEPTSKQLETDAFLRDKAEIEPAGYFEGTTEQKKGPTPDVTESIKAEQDKLRLKTEAESKKVDENLKKLE